MDCQPSRPLSTRSCGDAGYQMQLCGWAADVQEEIPAKGWGTISPESPILPIGTTASDFCTGYFD